MRICTGVDLLEIARMERSLARPRFPERCFSPRELRDYLGRGGRADYLAGCFSAKEAFSKALGTGVRGFALTDVTVIRDKLGKPCFLFSGRAEELVRQSGMRFDVSITHTKDHVLAFVVGYKE